MQYPRNPQLQMAWGYLASALLFCGFFTGASAARSSALLWNHPALEKAALRRAPQSPANKETWMGLYMGDKKIGYTGVHVTPATYKNKPALRTVSQGVTKMTVLGTTVEQAESQETISDLDYKPLAQTFDVKSNGSALHLEAVYDHTAGKVFCRLLTGGATTEKTLTIPPGANLVGDENFLTEGKKLSVGQKVSSYYLNPMSVELEEAKMEVTGRENVRDGEKTVSAFVVKSSLSLGQMTTWESEDGDTLKGEMSFGPLSLTMLKEPKAMALKLEGAAPLTPAQGAPDSKAYTPPTDFAVATAIVTDRPIDDPRTVRSLKATISGLPGKQFVLSDARQQGEIVPAVDANGSVTAKYTITTAPFDAGQSALLPISDATTAPYRSKAAYLNTADVNISSTAERLRGSEKNAYRVAVNIRNWVHKAMTPDASIGVPRSASDIFLRRRGVCRDYATLYTALARSAGIPTRLCGGIVYAEGKFFYHAWAESYVGQWVTFDPTLYNPAQPVEYVDATHIKFAEGDATSMFGVVAVIGKLHITIQDFAQ